MKNQGVKEGLDACMSAGSAMMEGQSQDHTLAAASILRRRATLPHPSLAASQRRARRSVQRFSGSERQPSRHGPETRPLKGRVTCLIPRRRVIKLHHSRPALPQSATDYLGSARRSSFGTVLRQSGCLDRDIYSLEPRFCSLIVQTPDPAPWFCSELWLLWEANNIISDDRFQLLVSPTTKDDGDKENIPRLCALPLDRL